MSILIKGMEMPTSCAKCKLFGEYGCAFIGAVGYALTEGRRSEDCPLIPVPPHGDLIDRKPFVEFIKTHWDSYDQWFVEQLEARPAIIEAEEGE